MEYLKMFLILGPLLFLTGFVDSVAGGGGLISIPAYLFVGLPVHLASGTNKVVNGIGTASATWRFFRSGKIRMRIALWAAAGALGGAFVGARLALRMPEAILQACLLVALPVVAVFLAVKKDFGKTGSPAGKELPPAKEHLLSLLIGLVIGLYDGLVGPGTGTFLIRGFTLVLGMDLITASGCAKVVNLSSNIASAAVWIAGGKVIWSIVLPAVIFVVAGNQCGARYAIRGGSDKVRGMIFVVLGMLFVKMIWELMA